MGKKLYQGSINQMKQEWSISLEIMIYFQTKNLVKQTGINSKSVNPHKQSQMCIQYEKYIKKQKLTELK